MFHPLQAIIDLILPPRCPGCRTMVNGDGRFCTNCWLELQFITTPICARCGTPFEIDRGPNAECGPCLAEPPRYAQARAALVYGGPARKVLLSLKHGDRQYLARMMAAQMTRAGAGMLSAEALLVPVPLHRWRLWRRGFNQSALLARSLATSSGAALGVDALLRVKPTPASAGMGREARARNVRGVFRVRDKAQVRGRTIVLIDDVMTTGATANACARVLQRAGAQTVFVLTFARAVRSVEEGVRHGSTGAIDRKPPHWEAGDENG